jgi:hypothetical protein
MGPIQLDEGMAQWQVLWNAILSYIEVCHRLTYSYFTHPTHPPAYLPLGP